jgi:putative salt-induced outer membrane protein
MKGRALCRASMRGKKLMMISKSFAAASAVALLAGAPAFAQSNLTGMTAINDQVRDIERTVQDDFARSEDEARFGNPESKLGLSGSLALSYSGSNGNQDTQDLTIGARMRHSTGVFVQTVGLAIEFSEGAGTTTEKSAFGVYDANYYFNNSDFYGFVLGRINTDGLATTAADYKNDGFLGFGPGYRIVNTPATTWRVQAGVGASYLEDGVGASTTEVGYIASSRFYHRFSETLFATMDTDVLKSDTALRVNNELGMNFAMTKALSTRVSYITDYNDARAIKTDNKLGVSLVVGF